MLKYRKEKYIKQRRSSRTGLWTFQVFIEYTDPRGRRQRFTRSYNEKNFATPRQAFQQALLCRDQKLHEYHTTGIRKEETATVAQVYERSKEIWIKSPESNRKKDSRFENYIRPVCGQRPIQKVTALDITATLNAMITNCSDNTIQSVFTLWKEIMKTARMMNLITVNPMEEVICPRSAKRTEKRPVTTDYATLEQVIAALHAHGGSSERSRFDNQVIEAALWTMYYTGMRPAECFALDKSDILASSIRVSKCLGLDENRHSKVRRPKTEQSNRLIPVLPQLRRILDSLMELQDSDHLFAQFNGEYFTLNCVSNKIHRCCKMEGIEFNMYRLRHLFSTDLVTAGTDPRTVMELMGHKKIDMTVEYARSSDPLKTAALQSREKH